MAPNMIIIRSEFRRV